METSIKVHLRLKPYLESTQTCLKDRKLVGRVMRTIKEDKNLLSQFQFYNALP